MIRDPEYVNIVLKSSFDHFSDRIFLVDEKTNPLDEHLFFLRGNKWRYLRNKISPLFSQVKLKWMYEEIDKCVNLFDECLAELSDGKDLDIKELLARYTTDVVASCGFGIEPQCLKNPSSEFRKIGREYFDPNKINMRMLFLRLSIPRLLMWFKIKTVSAKINNFFLTTTKNILHHRRSTGVVRKDFVQLLLELKEKGTVEIDTTEIEKDETYKESPNEKIETLRIYPSVPALNRECMKDFTLPDGTVIEKGLHVLVPILSLHRDPKYFPEPLEYKPDRFENPPVNGTYMPFGDGPRTCIGKLPLLALLPFCCGGIQQQGGNQRKRFAEAAMTSVLARSLEKYKFELSPMNNCGDIKLNPKVITSSPLHGIFLRIHKL
ncbi:unnamed protein product [Nezara viridula]|uniref:Cytochrome P450 n=1 Tax=Nezara viridula TaxID=85310 RepID=A0A9P0H592_NEZVI|nr:unnamed protein product [Nezara viridula]